MSASNTNEIANAFEQSIDAALHELEQLTLAPIPVDPGQVKSLRDRFGDGVASIILDSVRLQKKAKQKFGTVGTYDGPWWAISPSLEQSTAWQVAAVKASWASGRDVIDLCCGMGGDALQFAGLANRISGFDRDPIIAAIARANLALAYRDHQWKIECADATKCDVDPNTWLHIDPDRRSEGKRTTNPDTFQPGWDQVIDLVNRAGGAMIKLAPATKMDPGTPIQPVLKSPVHRCWISLSGSVREQTWLVGEACQRDLSVDGSRSAIVVRTDGSYSRFFEADQSDEAVSSHAVLETASPKTVGRWIIDPDRAVRAAGLTASFCQSFQLLPIGSLTGFLTQLAERLAPQVHDFAIAKQVLWCGSADDRKLRRTLREHDWSVKTVKSRGTDHQPEKLVTRYKRIGEQPVILWIGRSVDRVFAVITET